MRGYTGHDYLSFDDLHQACLALAEDHPDWVELEVVGESRHGRPLLLLSIGRRDGQREQRPGVWLDGGTHAAEWAGVMAALYAATRWAEALSAGDAGAQAWFSAHSAYVMPCLSPDGYQALIDGAPYLRSTLRPPPDGQPRVGLDPQDIDGDGCVRWMRWRHPAGTHVPDEDEPMLMRRRRLGDDPARAYFYCEEGVFLNWDGQRWVQAPRPFGLDLNRNFPSSWAPFSMFGMDGGVYPLSEPESRAAVEAFAARPMISAAVSNHTYTGCLLTQPYRAESPLGEGDIALMKTLADEATRGTHYKVYKVHPDFTYDAKKAIVGVWADGMSTTFGVPGYTLELWNPYGYAGQEVKDPASFFRSPDEDVIRAMLKAFAAEPGGVIPWRPARHPQLGEVEIGGVDYMRTIRNPPLRLMPEECAQAFTVIERMRQALPRVEARLEILASEGALHGLELVLENLGMLSSSGLRRAAELNVSPGVSARLELGPGLEIVSGAPEQALPHLDGWGTALGGLSANPIYPGLPAGGHRAVARWWLRGQGTVRVIWRGGRGGVGEITADIS
ncbi:MAG: hypothetical protein H6741_09015 [Alphaproteobacteria bacterium]|nr:hypothetical protein [Alphaproteobacteria bacterium]